MCVYKFLHCYLYTTKINLNFTFKAYAKKVGGVYWLLNYKKMYKKYFI